MITQERLKELLDYEEETGFFRWKVSGYAQGRKAKGKIAGTVTHSNTIAICLDKKIYRADRLAILYMTGKYPNHVLHNNGDVADNRWCNLEDSRHRVNRHVCRTNTGIMGVSIIKGKKTNMFAGAISKDKKRYQQYFPTLEEAKEWVENLRRELYG